MSKCDITRQKLFFKIFNTSRGTTFSPTVLPENDFKRVLTTHFCRKLPKRRLFGLKMTSYVKMRCHTTKKFFKIFNTSRGTTFPTTVQPENDIKRVLTTHFCRKLPKRRLFGLKMTSYVKMRRHTTKKFFSKYSTRQGEQLFLQQFCLKTTLKGCKLLIFVKNCQKDVFLG